MFRGENSLYDRKLTAHLLVLNMDQLNAFLKNTPRVAHGHEDESSEDCQDRDPRTPQLSIRTPQQLTLNRGE